MKRILFITLGLHLSGQSVHLLNLVKALTPSGYEFHLATGSFAEGKPLGKERFEGMGVTLHYVPFPGFDPSIRYLMRMSDAALKLAALVKKLSPTIVHIHSATLLFCTHLANLIRLGQFPPVVTTFNNEEICGAKLRLARTALRVLPHAMGHVVVAISSGMRDSLLNALPLDPDCVLEISYSADESYFFPPSAVQRREARFRLAIPSDGEVVSTVGRIIPRKNMMGLVKAFEIARHKYPGNLYLLIAGEGDGDYPDELERYVRRQGLADRVFSLGFTDPRVVYWASDAFALVSFEEGFGLVACEAMLCGLPVTRSRSNGASDQITDGINGVMVDAGSPTSIAEGMLRCLEPQNRAVYGDEARQSALADYSLASLRDSMDAVYRRVT